MATTTISGFLSKNDADVWVHTPEPVIMENSKGHYVIATLNHAIDEKEGVLTIEPQFISNTEEMLKKLKVDMKYTLITD